MRIFNPLRLAALVLVAGLATITLHAQQQPQEQMGQSAGAQSAPAQEQPQTFAGKIVKSKGDWVLKDQATGTMYKLDNEDQAKQYAGKNVKVTGTVDTATNTIHIANIEMGASEPSSPK